jgi:hypothetical protein
MEAMIIEVKRLKLAIYVLCHVKGDRKTITKTYSLKVAYDHMLSCPNLPVRILAETATDDELAVYAQWAIPLLSQRTKKEVNNHARLSRGGEGD